MAPGAIGPESNAVPVTVCGMRSPFVHVTVFPTLTVVDAGTKPFVTPPIVIVVIVMSNCLSMEMFGVAVMMSAGL